MSHLGDRVAPLIDGELPLDASERAMTHMAACPHCQEAADLERLTKQRLAGLGTPEPGPDFMARLMSLGTSSAAPPMNGPLGDPMSGPAGGYLAGGSGRSYLSGGSGTFGADDASGFAAAAFVPAARHLTMPPPVTSATPGRGTPAPASRSPRGSSRPPQNVSRSMSRSARNRIVLAAASAACLVGVGVAGGVAAPSSARSPVSPPADSFSSQSGIRAASAGQTALLRVSSTSPSSKR